MNKLFTTRSWLTAVFGIALVTLALSLFAAAQDQYPQDQSQDQQEDPPTRVARLGYMEGSVSFRPAGESDWVQAVSNRPMTTGDNLWTDQNSRAELQLGSAMIRLSENTGFSFLNLDDRTVQIQLTSGALNVRMRRLDRDDAFEIDTPNLAFSIYQPGSYRVEASEDGTYSVISLREGEGEATGNGQNYTLHAGQRATFSGTDTLNAEVVNISGPDQFDNWAYQRDHRYDDSRSAQYLSHDVVGYEDLDDYGDWRDDSNYGHVWFPNRVDADWAPYHQGHWDWIAPWGYTWVDDSPWGYAPFHYGRWVTLGGRWGWVAGPPTVAAVYAPALVVFIGGGGGGFGGNVGWFPLGPREVYVPPYQVSRGYMNRVNISNTRVESTTITNVYNTTIINKTTNITNVTYVNRNVRGAVTAVPQRAFAGAQPVARSAVRIDERQLAAAPVTTRAAIAPTRESVLGARAATANQVKAPPAAVANRQVIAKRTPPPPPVPFARQQQALAANPGRPLQRQQLQQLRPAATAAPRPMVKQAPAGKPATPTVGRPGSQPNAARPGQPGNQPANQTNPGRPGQPNMPPANQPGNRPGNQPIPNERPGAANPAQPNRPPAAQPNRPVPPEPSGRPAEPNRPNEAQPNRPTPPPPVNRPVEPNRPNQPQPNDRPPAAQPNNRPDVNRPENNRPNPPEPNRPVPNNRPDANRPAPVENNRPNNPPEAARPNRPVEPPARNERPIPPKPNNRPEASRPEPNRPEPRAEPSRPEPGRNTPPRPETPPPSERPQPRTPPPPEARPEPQPQRQPARPQTPAEKKQEEDRKKPPVI